MRFVPFEPGHLTAFQLQPRQRIWLARLPTLAEQLSASPAFSLRVGDDILGCAGVFPHADARMGWCALSEAAGPYLFFISRAVTAFLDGLPGLTYTAINPGFPQAVKWAGMLGFAATGKPAYTQPDGTVLGLYARAAGEARRPARPDYPRAADGRRERDTISCG